MMKFFHENGTVKLHPTGNKTRLSIVSSIKAETTVSARIEVAGILCIEIF